MKEKEEMSDRKNGNLRNLTGIGIFSALAAVVSFATAFLKFGGFLSLDAGDIVVVMASFIYGPLSGLLVSLITSLISFLYSGTGFWGLLMDFCSTASFTFVASYIYSKKKTFKSAIIGISASILCTTALMMPLNILITPLYTGAPTAFVIEKIPVLLLPFNFAKTLFNGSFALILYKSVVGAMRAARLAPPASVSEGASNGSPRTRYVALAVGGVALLIAVGALILIASVQGFKWESPLA